MKYIILLGIGIFMVSFLCIYLITKAQKIQYYPQTTSKMPYRKKYLLTKNEYRFYILLKPIIENLNLQIIAKIRLADLVEVESTANRSKWYTYFNRIKAKHIDFAIVDNMKVIMLIELDDSSHQRNDRKRRDYFVNSVLISTGYILVRTTGSLQPIKQALSDKGYYINEKQPEKSI